MPDEHTLNPWVDFRYGNEYASTYGLLRVSNGSRYNDNLVPTLNDKTAEVPGGDGTYYFNSYYKQRSFSINFAYDHLTETELRAVRNWLNGKEIKELEFDERPGRIYFAKVTGAPSFKYLAFDTYDHKSNNTNAQITYNQFESTLVYKGEGSVTFTCYDPYAYSAEITSAITSNSRIAVGGDLPTNFVISTVNGVAADTTITLEDASITPHVIIGRIELKQAVTSPLLETTINGATDCIINITGGKSLTLFEAEDAAEIVRAAANTDVNIIFGAVINEALTEEVIVTVIATGFEEDSEPLYQYSNETSVKEKTSRVEKFDEDDIDIPVFLRNRDI